MSPHPKPAYLPEYAPMGYTTEFEGIASVAMDGSGPFGHGHDDDIRELNKPPAGQPGLWCRWERTKDGTAIKWNGVEKSYYAEEWMTYDAQGDDDDDRWRLIVTSYQPAITRLAEPRCPAPGAKTATNHDAVEIGDGEQPAASAMTPAVMGA
jgi:hypothetical protein